MTRVLPAAVFGLLTALNLLSVATGNSTLEWLTKPLLMPVLLWLLLARGAAEPRTKPWLLTGLVSATVADIALLVPGESALLTGIGFFAMMQLCFITAYTRVTRILAGWRTLLWIPLAYLAFWLGFNTLMWTSFGTMALPIAVYSLLLATMAAAASAISVPVGLGGLLFMVSDLMIGLGIANIDFPGRGVAIMATYCAAQFLIITGLAGRGRADRPRV